LPGLSREEVRARFGRPELAALWRVLRDRLERTEGPVRTLRVRLPTQEERLAVADLLGLDRMPGKTTTVSVARLDTVLAELGLDTQAVVEAVGGPLRLLAAERREAAAARAELWTWLAGHSVVAAEPALLPWVDHARSVGLTDGSPEATRMLLSQALAMLAALPGGGGPLPELAARVCGDPHALDDGRRLSGYVLRALACRYDEPVPVSAAERRALWQRAGVACDALSVSVLTAGLRPAGNGGLAQTCRLWSDAGHAARLTLAQVRTVAALDAGAARVWVVENPAIVAATLDRFGPSCPPIVCTAGWPNTAVSELLLLLTATARPYIHADLDGDGLRIAAYVIARTGGQPWRMTAADYLAAAPAAGRPPGRVSDVPWDERVAAVMRKRNVAVPEELVAARLLKDMASSP
jgi:uncharacterized protein (TIGR02679 family)